MQFPLLMSSLAVAVLLSAHPMHRHVSHASASPPPRVASPIDHMPTGKFFRKPSSMDPMNVWKPNAFSRPMDRMNIWSPPAHVLPKTKPRRK